METTLNYLYSDKLDSSFRSFMPSVDARKIGKKIEDIRKKGKFSRKELSMLAGVGTTAIYELEKGYGNTKLSTLLQIVNALNIKIELKAPFVDASNEEAE